MKKVLLVLLVAFIIIQFFRIDKTNPSVNKDVDFITIKQTPVAMASTIKSACYDCHSNESKYPWYSNIQPVAWFLKNHINDGRKHLNFSEFASYEPKKQAHKLDECVEVIEKNEMPMESYVLMHNEAKLTDAQKAELISYFKQMSDDTRIKYSLPAETKTETENH